MPQASDIDALRRQIAELQAKLAAAQTAEVGRSGAVAQGDGHALGERSANVDGDNLAPINTGMIVNHYYARSDKRLTKEEIGEQVKSYLQWLRARMQNIELRGIERAGEAPVVLLPLETAYVPLCAKPMAHVGDAQARMDAQGGPTRSRDAHSDNAEGMGHEADIALDRVLRLANRLVIIGGVGSGKTTVLMHMAWALASSLLTGQAEPVQSRLGLTITPSQLPLPIFVPLASFARYRRTLHGNAPPREKTLAHFVSHHLISKHAAFDLPDDFFVQLLKDGRVVILLLDGLDEVANEDERGEVRQSVEELVSAREAQAMRVVVTCRAIAYRSGRTALAADFHGISVQPLDQQQHITPMVQQAYKCIYPHDATLCAERVNDLLHDIRFLEEQRRVRLGEHAKTLVNSPLMVRLSLIVHMNNRKLPDERADLFYKAINALLQVDYGREESDIRELSTNWRPFLDIAQHLAFHMHQQGREGHEIEELGLKKTLRKETEFEPRIDEFLSQVRQRGSVLEERDGLYRFIHLAFQEFLVARYLREVIGGEGREAILKFLNERLDDPWWREPILLLAGYLAANAGSKPTRDFISALAKSGETPDARFAAAELAGTAALEWRDNSESIRADCAKRIVALLGCTEELRKSKAVLRARAGDKLSRLGDPRFDPERFYLPADGMLGFVCIEADREFTIGTRKADARRVSAKIGADVPNNEINDIPIPTPEFWIARYPVTVAQFRAFVAATGFAIGDENVLRGSDSGPVRLVTWHEALEYCNWLNDQLVSSRILERCKMTSLLREHHWRVALPSELEWEKAVTGAIPKTVFPWGDTPNSEWTCDSRIDETSVVGCFPPNSFGLYDMIGNVWEWTRSLWGRDGGKADFGYPYGPDDQHREDLNAGNDVLRIVRGGSWRASQIRARSCYRGRNHPDNRLGDVGFRVVLQSGS